MKYRTIRFAWAFGRLYGWPLHRRIMFALGYRVRLGQHTTGREQAD
jgi:hypothetical protein